VARSFKVEFWNWGDETCLPDAALCIVGGVQVSELVVLVFDFVVPASAKGRRRLTIYLPSCWRQQVAQLQIIASALVLLSVQVVDLGIV
jgi:hypothetical protein